MPKDQEELSSDVLLREFIEAYELSTLADPVHFHEKRAVAKAQDNVQRRPASRRGRDAKQEINRLRQDVQRLEAELARVKTNAVESTRDRLGSSLTTQQSALGSAAPPETSIWMEVALHQFNRLQQAHATNRRLKRLLGKQLKIAKCLDSAFVHKVYGEDLNTMHSHRLPGLRPAHQSLDDELVFGSLLIHLQQLYAIKDLHVKQAGLEVDSLAMHTQRKHDPVDGTVYQTASSMALPFPVHKTDNVIADGLLNGHTKKSRPLINHPHNRIVMGDRVHKNYNWTFQHHDGTYDLHSRAVIRKYTEADRSVYAWAAVTVLASVGLRFFAQGMMIIEPSRMVPIGASVLKSWFRVHGEQLNASNPHDERANPLIDEVLKILTEKMVATFHWLENSLVDAGDSSEAKAGVMLEPADRDPIKPTS